MASEAKDEPFSNEEICYICRLEVPAGSQARHDNSLLHRASRQIAAVALDRLRAHTFPISASTPECAKHSEDEGADAPDKKTPLVSYCGACTATVPVADRASHDRSKTHLVAALDEQVFEELAREYIDEDDQEFLETPCNDPSDEDEGSGRVVREDKVVGAYLCHMCALQVPNVFRDDHEHSPRHRACVALASAAARRARAHLVPTHMWVDSTCHGKSLGERMTTLLKAYTGNDITKVMKSKETEISEDNEDESNEEDKSKVGTDVKKRLTPREYFTQILPFLQYVGSFYTLIIDDTDFVTIKTATDTYLRVHVANFNGLYNIGGNSEYQMKCRMCDGYDQNVSYSSKGHLDRLHVMSLGHIKHVLSPIDNVHGIRKIDDTHSVCVLCNVFLPSHSVENHTGHKAHGVLGRGLGARCSLHGK